MPDLFTAQSVSVNGNELSNMMAIVPSLIHSAPFCWISEAALKTL